MGGSRRASNLVVLPCIALRLRMQDGLVEPGLRADENRLTQDPCHLPTGLTK